MAEPVTHLFATLRRGFAGVRQDQLGALAGLGFKWREQVRQLPNTASVRGALSKVRAQALSGQLHARRAPHQACAASVQVQHLVSVETDYQHRKRVDRLQRLALCRAPVRVSHPRH